MLIARYSSLIGKVAMNTPNKKVKNAVAGLPTKSATIQISNAPKIGKRYVCENL
jgi:hypothetical protein